MGSFQYTVCLRVFSDFVHPSEVSLALGMKPKWIHVKGKQRKTPTGEALKGTYDQHYCFFPLAQQPGELLDEMLERVVNSLFFAKELFSRVHESGGRAEFFVDWISKGNTGVTLSTTLLSKLSELRLALALDIYGYDVDSSQTN